MTGARRSDTRLPVYPLAGPPGIGETLEVVPGVHWLRMPLPMQLDHINLWLLEDGEGWTVVDTGLGTARVKALWELLFERGLQGRPVNRVIVTHLHPDHVGLAGWLVRRWGVELWMTRTEYLMCRNLVADTGHEAPDEGVRFYAAAGLNEEQLARYCASFGGFGKVVEPLPHAFRRIRDGQRIGIAGREWRVMVGRGHSPEHACLFCPTLGLVISGDQILPTISSNVSVWPTEPHADPLREWLSSCAQLRGELPADVLVLPSHGKPFHGVRDRLSALIDEHEESLVALYDACAEPRRATDVFDALFRRPITDGSLIMATGESTAHLNCLIGRHRLTVEPDANDVLWYRQTWPA